MTTFGNSRVERIRNSGATLAALLGIGFGAGVVVQQRPETKKEAAIITEANFKLVGCETGPPSASIPPELQSDFNECTRLADPYPLEVEDPNLWLNFNEGRFSRSFYLSKGISMRINEWMNRNGDAASGAVAAAGAGVGSFACAPLGPTPQAAACAAAITALSSVPFGEFKDAARVADQRDSCIKVRIWKGGLTQVDATKADNEYCLQ